jgi:geranylgeranyl pyrophosphate synthase
LVAEGLRSVGYELGRVFQIRDDMLGVWGGPETGKPVGADITRKKKALPALHALSHASGAARSEIRAIFQKEPVEPADVERVLEIMDDLHTRSYCQTLAEDRWRAGRTVLQSLKLSRQTRRDFEELGDFLLIRES